METALQRAPILYIQTGNIQAAVNRYRYILIIYFITPICIKYIKKLSYDLLILRTENTCYNAAFIIIITCIILFMDSLICFGFDREILSAVESTTTQSLRVTLTRQLAEVLLRGISGADYKAPEGQTDTMGMIII